jgi:hypothetical protein
MAKHELLFRQHLYSIIVLLVFSLAAVVGAVAYWVGLPSWSELIVVVEGAGVAVHVTVVIAVMIAIVAGAITGILLRRKQQNKSALAALIKSHSDADRAACLEIKHWVEDEEIRRFLDQVQAEGRMFTVGEVETMRTHWDSRAARQAEAERAAAIDAACREVYVGNLIKP